MAKSEFANMTPEERRENGRKGGLASVKARREKKAMKVLNRKLYPSNNCKLYYPI